LSRQSILTTVFLANAIVLGACSGSNDARKRISPEYDQTTGKLKLLKYDSKGTGKVDTWSYMDGARIVRIEIDQNGDGKIDRWEYYDKDRKLEKIGFSRANDGKQDAWSYPGPDGKAIVKIDISTRRDGKVTRTEHYEQDHLVSAEEDTDEDGKTDKWETYEGDHLATVAFDTAHHGYPDRKLTYGPNGSATIEVDERGDGHFVPMDSRKPAPRPAK
jgi:hypothetical protein